MSAERPELRTSAFRTFSQFVLLSRSRSLFRFPEDPFALGMAVVFCRRGADHQLAVQQGWACPLVQGEHPSGFGLFSAVGIIGVILAGRAAGGFPLLVMMAFFTLISAVTSAWQLLLTLAWTR